MFSGFVFPGEQSGSKNIRIELRRAGKVVDAQNVSYASPSNAGRATGFVPADLPLDDYEPIVYLDGRSFKSSANLSALKFGLEQPIMRFSMIV